MRRRLRYFRLFGLMTVIFLGVFGLYWAAQRPLEPRAATEDDHQTVVPDRRYTVVVAATDLPPYTLIRPDAVQVRQVDAPPPPDAFTDPQQVTRRLTRTYLRAGDLVRQGDVTPPLPDGTLSALVPPGMVGMALPIARREQLPPVRPGDALRIYAVFAKTKVRPVAMRALVLSAGDPAAALAAAGQSSARSPEGAAASGGGSPALSGPFTLVVAVPPEEARAIALALDSGATLFYTLLPPAPLAPVAERTLTLDELVGAPAQKPAPSRPASPPPPPPPPARPVRARSAAPVAPVLVAPLPRPAPPPPSPPAPKNAPPNPSPPSPPSHAILGVMGDRPVLLTVPTGREGGKP